MQQSMAALLLLVAASASALDNGFGRTPVLGFNTYNDVGCSPTGDYVKATINALAARGFADLGYRYFQVDCGWQGYQRLSNGSITYDAKTFPDGIAPLSSLARSKGFRWSMYTDQGKYACDTQTPLRPGSLGYEKQDAAAFAAWNTEYVKVDNCYIESASQNAPKDPRTDFPSRFGAMSSALQNVGIKGMLVCQWGVPYASPSGLQGPATWTPSLATSFRVSDDIAQGWANVQRIMNQNIHVNLANASGPGHFSDMDLLEVGNLGMTAAEQQTHFAVWAMFKSALMVSTSATKMSDATFKVLSNKGLVSINQDTLGQPVKLVQRYTGNRDIFAGPLSNGDVAVLVTEQSGKAQTLSIDLKKQLCIASADVLNLWTGQTTRKATSYQAGVDSHGSLALRLSSMVRSPGCSTTPDLKYVQAASGTLSGGANIQQCSGCSGGNKVGYLGQNGAGVTLRGITASSSTATLYFDYLNCEIGYLADQGPNARTAAISVNGGAPQSVSFPLTGYNWDRDVLRQYRVELSGFVAGKDNSITITGLSGGTTYGPDLDRVGFAA